MSSIFNVDLKGFRSLMIMKPKWHFVRELISNSLDEVSVSDIRVRLQKDPRWLLMEVTDNGNGFERLSDAYTLFAHTGKRSNAEVRGRFNMGEKELASVAKEMTIETTTGKVVFKDGKRKMHPRTKRDNGTVVFAKISCSKHEFAEILDMVHLFMIPSDKTMHVDWVDSSIDGDYYSNFSATGTDEADWSVDETLETVLFDKETGGMRSTKRKTTVGIHKRPLPRTDVMSFAFRDPQNHYGYNNKPVQSYLYELGIPVQPIDCKYSVNVNQKIPMNANRDSVKDSYLRDIYALVLNQTYDDLFEDEVSEGWVKIASDDDLVTDDAFKSLQKKRYGEKAVMWSSDLQANEDAIASGYTVIHGKTMSKTERQRFNSVGMVSSKQKFQRGVAPTRVIPRSEWTDSMYHMSVQCELYASLVRLSAPRTRFIESKGSNQIASYNKLKHEISFNVCHMGGKDFDHESVQNIATMIHEFAHVNVGSDPNQIELHGKDFYDAMARHGALLLKQYKEDQNNEPI